MNYQVLLYYKFIRVNDPKTERDAQRAICENLNLLGRIIVGPEGINGTVSGTKESCHSYIKYMNEHKLFHSIQFKIDDAEYVPFPKLSVKARDEVVTIGNGNLDVNEGATRLSPDEFHRMVNEEDAIIFDARNNYESAIGKFKNSITPNISNFRDLPGILNEYEDLKDKKVITICTGGIRCEKASVIMKQQGFEDIYQLEGGIVEYAKKYPNGQWEGECYVFDDRIKVAFKDDPELLGRCAHCAAPTNEYVNCRNVLCNKQTIMCPSCEIEHEATCSSECHEILAHKQIAQ